MLAGVEVGHERRDVLRGREPGVDVLARVEEAAGGDGDVADLVAIEGEVERQVDRGGASRGTEVKTFP